MAKRRRPSYVKRIKDALNKFLAIRINRIAVVLSTGIMLASFIPILQGDIFFLSAMFGIVGEVLIGSIYLIWNVGALALLLLIETDIEAHERIWTKFMFKRNLFVAVLWIIGTIGILIVFSNLRQAPLLLFGAEIIILMYIKFYTTYEESPFLESTSAFDRTKSEQ